MTTNATAITISSGFAFRRGGHRGPPLPHDTKICRMKGVAIVTLPKIC